jgi:hypothetical protein
MCWNAEVSLITFITSSLLCAYLWYRNDDNDRVIASWVFSFAIMQLLEFFMWINLNSHSFVSKISLISLYLQPIVLGLALLYLGKYHTIINEKNTKYLIILLLVIVVLKLIQIIYFVGIQERTNKWSSIIGKNCHLVWHFFKSDFHIPILRDSLITYHLPLILFTLLIKPFGYIYTIIGLITNYYSKYVYGNEQKGSIWCWIINILPLITIGTKYI